MSRFVSLLKLKKNTSATEETQQTTCTKCGKRPMTSQDGLCDQCRFSDILTQLVDERP